jgi:hypothetical protein
MPSTHHQFRCSDELWEKAQALAAETGTSVSALVVDFLSALVGGKVEPFEHAPRDGHAFWIDPETWKLLQPAIAKAVTHDVHMTLAKSLRHLENPLPRRAVAKTSGARVPETPIPRPVREPVKKALKKEAGPPLDPAKCKHEDFRLRNLGRLGFWCSCGSHKDKRTGTWLLPAKEKER